MTNSENSNSASMVRAANVDELISKAGGFGLFQVLTLCVLLIASALAAFPFAEFIFVAKDVHTRCFIPECESFRNIIWEPDWLKMTVPSTANRFDQCSRFTPAYELGICYEEFFTNETEPCQTFVHENRDTIIHDFEIECNEWLRVLIGLSHGLALVAFQPFAWFLADRAGRSSVVITCTFCSIVLSLIRATSVNYEMYIVLYLTSSAFSGGALTASYILGTEIVGRKWKSVAAAVVGIGFALGQSLFGVIAWFVDGWRIQMLLAYGPQPLLAIYLLLLPETVTWLLKKGQVIAAEKAVKKMAQMNSKILPTKDIVSAIEAYQKRKSVQKNEFSSLRLVIKVWKIFAVSVWWMTCTLVFFSMTINADVLTDDVFLNFIVVCLVEIPGHLLVAPCILLLGRNFTLILAFAICAGTSFALPLIPIDSGVSYMLVYLTAKGSISAAFTCIFVFTFAVVPTNRKTLLMTYASTIGRIGGALAMFSPLTVIAESGVSPFLFGALAAASAVIAILEKLLKKFHY